MRGSIGITSAFEWIFHGTDKLTPGGSFTFRDPAVTLTPLDSNEFRQGMMKPVGASYFAELLRQGWDSDVVKDLIVENVGCVAAPDPNPIREERRILVSSADAVKILREGAGDKIKLKLLTEQNDPEKVWVVMSTEPEPGALEIDRSICPLGGLDTKTTKFRSPLSMINYLGASGTHPHFQVSTGRPANDQSVLVATQYRSKYYYVSHGRKSAQTLALLAEIIGFQTTNATLDASKPTVTVPATD